MSPESSQERPDQNASETKALSDAGAKQKPDGTWEATCDLGKSGAGTDITTVQFRKIHGIWQWTNNSEPAGKWLGSPRFPTNTADGGVNASRAKMNKLADALGVKTDANKQNEIDAKETKTLSDGGAAQKPDGTWEVTSSLGKSGAGTDITTVQFRKVHDTWQWTNNSEPTGKWFGSPRFPTNGTDLAPDVKANRERMNKLADDLGVKANAQLEGEQALQAAIDDYLAKEKVAANAGITPDVEYHVAWIDDSLGYVPFLEHVLEEMKDKDEWLADSSNEAQLEKNLLQSTAQSIRRNLNGLSKALDAAPQKSGKAYEHLRSIYLERAKRYTELTASVNEDEENVELRDATLATQQAAEMLPHMTMDEAIDWVKQALSSIDGNNWQSSGLKATYGKLINTCKAALQKKLVQEKGEINNDPAKASSFCGHAMELAKLFTDRGSPIDSDLTDIDFAEGMAKDAMGFEELAMRYVEKSLSEKNPLKNYVAEKKGAVLAKFSALPPEQRTDQIVNIESTLNGNPTDVAGISEQYALLRNIETQLSGQPEIKQEIIQGEINKEFTPFLESAYVKFETFLNGTIGGAANLGEINAAIGEPGLNPMQVEAWKLLADIQGYGYDVSDKTWSYVAMGAKIAAMIAAGIAVGIATGGLGVVAAALAGGAAMTGVNAVINQQGFDNLEDAFKTYGKDFAVNAATMGAARYLAAGRTAFQLSRAGLLQQAGGLSKVFSIAGKAGGAKLLGSLDDASSLGTRLLGATGEGTADLVIGTSLDTAIKGGEFMENLQGNAMFFGLSFAEFGQQGIGGLWKKLRSAPDEQLHGLSQLVNKANLGRMNIHKLSGGIHVEDLLSSTDPTALLKKGGVDDKELKQIFEELDGLKQTKAEFEEAFKKAAALPDAPNTAAPQSDEEKIEAIKTTIMTLPDTPEGLAKRVEAGAFVLGGKPGDLTPAQSQAILDAHAIPMADGQKYSMAELKQKMQILEAGGFTREQADTLLRMGVCGAPPPPPPVPPKKNAFGVPPPPLVPGRRPNMPPPPPAIPGRMQNTSSSPSAADKPSEIRTSTPEKPAASVPNNPKASTIPTKAPERMKPIVTPDLSGRIAKAADIAGDPGVRLNPELMTILDDTLQKADIRVYIHDKLNPEHAQSSVGYQTFGNERADLNAPRDASGSGSISDRDPRATSIPQASNRTLKRLLQEINYKRPDKTLNMAANRESIRLAAESPPGKKSLVYMYSGINYKDSGSMSRPGTVMGVLVQLDAKDADAAFAALKKNPEQARAFFIAASADVKRSDRIWGERRPNYDEANNDRQLVFAKENGKDAMPDISFVKPGTNGWQESPPTEADQRLLKDLAKEIQGKNQSALRPQSSAPKKPEPKKGLWDRFFG